VTACNGSGDRDVDLALRAQAGDLAAFEALYHRLHPLACRAALRVTRHPDTAEDVAATIWLWLVEGRWRFDPDTRDGKLDRFVGHLAKCEAYRAIYRAPKLDRETITIDLRSWVDDDDSDVLRHLHARTPSPETRLLRRELRQRIVSAIASLSPALRRVALLRYAHHVAEPDIEIRLGLAKGAAAVYLYRCRAALRRALADVITTPEPARLDRRRVRYARAL
jgi:RNA polymerase sigma factor (sigma-70 family)